MILDIKFKIKNEIAKMRARNQLEGFFSTKTILQSLSIDLKVKGGRG